MAHNNPTKSAGKALQVDITDDPLKEPATRLIATINVDSDLSEAQKEELIDTIKALQNGASAQEYTLLLNRLTEHFETKDKDSKSRKEFDAFNELLDTKYNF